MRLFITTALAALAVAGAASAQTAAPATAPSADSGRYISVAGGVTDGFSYDYELSSLYRLEAEGQSGPQIAVAFGQRISPDVRVEIAAGARSNDISAMARRRIPGGDARIDADKATILSIDLNAYYDLPTKTRLKPYVGAGFGAASVKINDGVLDDDGSTLSVQGIAGLSFQATPRFALFAEGRYQYLKKIKIEIENTGYKDKLDLSSVGALAGVRISF